MSWEKTIDARIERRHEVADGIICLDIVPKNGCEFPPFEAGSHIDVYIDEKCIRQYSLCNAPSERNRYRLGILLEVSGRGGSAAIHQDFLEGRDIKIGPPRNQFPLIEGASHFVLVAGGIGITPMIAMMHQLLATDASFELHYSSRTRRRAAFLSELISEDRHDRVHIYFDDGVTAERFNPSVHIPKCEPGAHLYVCGPSGFMDAVIAAAKVAGWPESAVHLERFANEINKLGNTFEVEARLSGKIVNVVSEETIAEALQTAGIDVPLSCESGICGTCLVDVIEGTPEHRDTFQSDEEKASNKQITVCCSRSLSTKLVLNI